MSKEKLIKQLNKKLALLLLLLHIRFSFWELEEKINTNPPLENAYDEGVKRGLRIAISDIKEFLEDE